MPLAADPNQTFTASLERDKDRQPKTAFRFRYLTGRGWLAANEFLDNPESNRITGENMLRLATLLAANLVGWEGLGATFEPGRPADSLLDALCYQDMLDLLVLSRRQASLTEDDLKNSPSPSPGPSAGSAAAGAEGANAETNPASENLSR